MKKYMMPFIKAMVCSYVLSAAALFVLAFLLYQLDIREEHLRVCMLVIYVIACLFGGVYIGRKVKKRQFLWGLLVGLLYYSIHIAGVIAVEGISPERIVPWTALALLCMGSGMMGGLLA